MSNYNSTATATIYVNGQPAQQTIAKLKEDVLGYRKRLQEIAADKSLGVIRPRRLQGQELKKEQLHNLTVLVSAKLWSLFYCLKDSVCEYF